MISIASIRSTLPALALALMTSLVAAQGLLDGRKFVADAGYVGKEADEKGDVITFADGRFHSLTCDRWGFNKAEYKATKDGDLVSFEATTVSDSDDRLHWRGAVRGDLIEGKFTHHRKPRWYRPNPEPLEHWFKGKVVN